MIYTADSHTFERVVAERFPLSDPVAQNLTAHALVRTYLRDPDRRLWPWIDVAQLERLVASIGFGTDPLEGEEPVAMLLHTGTTRGGCLQALDATANLLNPIRWMVRAAMKSIDWNYGALITDQRIVIRDWLDAVDAPYAAIEEPTCTGGFGSFFGFDFLNFTVGEERHHLTVPGHKALQRFLVIAVDEAKNQRLVVERIPAPVAEAGDPSGAVTFLAHMRVEDPRASVLLQLVATSVAERSIEDGPGLDLARRIALFHRATVGARGSRDGMWVSPLRVEELLAFLESRLGVPERSESDEGLQVVTFHRDPEHAKAAAGTALLLLTGTLDAVLPKGEIRVTVEERTHPQAGDYTAYRTEVRVPGMWQPMSEFESKALYELHLQLLAFEAQVLLRRVIFGTAVEPEELLGADQEQVDELLAKEAPGASAKWFSSPRDFANVHKRVADKPPRFAMNREQIPAHLTPPAPTTAPSELVGIGFSNLLAGLLTTFVLAGVYCFGGVGMVQWLESAVLAKVDGLDEEATSGALMLLLMFQWGALMLAGPIRSLGGLIVLMVPRSGLIVGGMLVLQGFVGMLVLDLPGLFAGLATAWWLSRKRVREYLL